MRKIIFCSMPLCMVSEIQTDNFLTTENIVLGISMCLITGSLALLFGFYCIFDKKKNNNENPETQNGGDNAIPDNAIPDNAIPNNRNNENNEIQNLINDADRYLSSINEDHLQEEYLNIDEDDDLFADWLHQLISNKEKFTNGAIEYIMNWYHDCSAYFTPEKVEQINAILDYILSYM